MELFGNSIEIIYFSMLVISGLITLLYLFFGDVLEGTGEILGFLSPALILAFVTFFSAIAYLLELFTSFNHTLVIIIGVVGAFILDSILNIFILIPLSSAQESLAYSTNSLKGRVGKVIISIPKDGFGEIVLHNKSGTISKPAASFHHTNIKEGQSVLIIEARDGVVYVTQHEYSEDIFL
ncbi:hypothetical protein [Bacillus massilinigeriensis]|uniref:hypothetical protein n=1 Tax=Bacillus massilionigeriensis TaxID=1805475 RepID=UPI00096AEBEB|nr:hypothetical protein [Bacillus massilionigeriensis]